MTRSRTAPALLVVIAALLMVMALTAAAHGQVCCISATGCAQVQSESCVSPNFAVCGPECHNNSCDAAMGVGHCTQFGSCIVPGGGCVDGTVRLWCEMALHGT